MQVPSITSLLLLLGLSFFFGLAFEDFYATEGARRPGGIRTFPLLALAGGALYLLDPAHGIPLAAGLLVIGAWLYVDYRSAALAHHAHANDLELIVPVCNLLAYLLGPIALAGPHWLAVGMTVAGVLLLTGRERLHALARRIELREIVTAGEFLILTGLVLPLLPDEPVTGLTAITPYKAWLALLTVCSISYASYLLRRYAMPEAGDFWVAALGGLYSSTATTVVLARRTAKEHDAAPRAVAGIILATALMYPRIFAIVAVFNWDLALAIAPPLLLLALLGGTLAFVQAIRSGAARDEPRPASQGPRNPLELGAAAIFALLFVVVSVMSNWVVGRFGTGGITFLAAIVGVTDVDPFVLSLAQGGTSNISSATAAAAILIASGSNNLLKAAYAVGIAGWRTSLPAVGSLILLALGAAFWAFKIIAGW